MTSRFAWTKYSSCVAPINLLVRASPKEQKLYLGNQAWFKFPLQMPPNMNTFSKVGLNWGRVAILRGLVHFAPYLYHGVQGAYSFQLLFMPNGFGHNVNVKSSSERSSNGVVHRCSTTAETEIRSSLKWIYVHTPPHPAGPGAAGLYNLTTLQHLKPKVVKCRDPGLTTLQLYNIWGLKL